MGVTIKDVAEAAGVSISTVSKVLNGHYSISEKTAERVRGIMREMNYYPNANAQSFASGSNHTVVLLANLAPNAAFQNPHMFEIISGLEEALCKRGYRLILRVRTRPPPAALPRRSSPAAARTPLPFM